LKAPPVPEESLVLLEDKETKERQEAMVLRALRDIAAYWVFRVFPDPLAHKETRASPVKLDLLALQESRDKRGHPVETVEGVFKASWGPMGSVAPWEKRESQVCRGPQVWPGLLAPPENPWDTTLRLWRPSLDRASPRARTLCKEMTLQPSLRGSWVERSVRMKEGSSS